MLSTLENVKYQGAKVGKKFGALAGYCLAMDKSPEMLWRFEKKEGTDTYYIFNKEYHGSRLVAMRFGFGWGTWSLPNRDSSQEWKVQTVEGNKIKLYNIWKEKKTDHRHLQELSVTLVLFYCH